MAELAVAACVNHPGREALGVCVRCRTQVCSECSTKVEGINYCVKCLEGVADEGDKAGRLSGGASRAGWFGTVAYLLLLAGLVWFQLEALMPGAG